MRADVPARASGTPSACVPDPCGTSGAGTRAAAGEPSVYDESGMSCESLIGRTDALAAELLRWCAGHGLKIACAESLTGGLLADAFVRVPGASAVFLGSAVTYDLHAKAKVLGVDAALLAREGAVHPQVARSMAYGAAALYAQPAYGYGDAVVGLSTTGVAGPGPDGDKPAGLVYAGFSLPASFAAGLSGNGNAGNTFDGCPSDGGPCGGGPFADMLFDGDREASARRPPSAADFRDASPSRLTCAVELRLHGSREGVRRLAVLRVLQNLSRFTASFQE